jgi:hypothetical protein
MGADVFPILTETQIDSEFGLLWFDNYHSAAEIYSTVERFAAQLASRHVTMVRSLASGCPVASQTMQAGQVLVSGCMYRAGGRQWLATPLQSLALLGRAALQEFTSKRNPAQALQKPESSRSSARYHDERTRMSADATLAHASYTEYHRPGWQRISVDVGRFNAVRHRC